MSVGDVEVASGIHGDRGRTVQLGAGGRTAVAGVAWRAVARHGGDHPVRDLADALVMGVGDVEVAGGVHGDALGIGQLGAGGRASIAAEAGRPVSRHQGQDARCAVQSQDAVLIREEHVARPIGRDVLRCAAQAGGRSWYIDRQRAAGKCRYDIGLARCGKGQDRGEKDRRVYHRSEPTIE